MNPYTTVFLSANLFNPCVCFQYPTCALLFVLHEHMFVTSRSCALVIGQVDVCLVFEALHIVSRLRKHFFA